MSDLVIGCPVWDRAWCLDLWFDSVEANVDASKTGLVFVVPPSDQASREVIARRSPPFDWVEVLRDRLPQFGRDVRAKDRHGTLAVARNQILQIAWQAQPRHFLSWDSDLLIPPRLLPKLIAADLPILTVWTWLNRQKPRVIRQFDGEQYREVYWQDAVQATAMQWDKRAPGRALHYPGDQFTQRSEGIWRCDVALAFQLMQPSVFRIVNYAPHPDGEDLPFNAFLEKRGIPRHCYGAERGVHLYDRSVQDEVSLGWPQVMHLSEQEPLAATWSAERSLEFEAFGFFPRSDASAADTV